MSTRRHSHKRIFRAVIAIPTILIGFGLSAPSTQAGYIVTLTQQGSNVVATGSGSIDFTDLGFVGGSFVGAQTNPTLGRIFTGPVGAVAVGAYAGFTGPASFGSGG
jgi:hypothetical protein